MDTANIANLKEKRNEYKYRTYAVDYCYFYQQFTKNKYKIISKYLSNQEMSDKW
jgi:hypothetical protein